MPTVHPFILKIGENKLIITSTDIPESAEMRAVRRNLPPFESVTIKIM